MRRVTRAVLVLPAILLALPAHAKFQTVSGTVTLVVVNSTTSAPAETVDVKLSNMPAVTGCTSGGGFFEFNATSVTDAQTRKNMVAALYEARATGATISIVYDDAGAFCSTFGYAVPVAVEF
jgi:hypothetical protein